MAAAAGATAAEAAPVAFRVAPQANAQALIEFALQARISLVGAQVCPGLNRAGLQGHWELEPGLRRLLSGSGCGFRFVDPSTVQILPPAPAVRAGPAAPSPVAELLVTATKRRLPAERIAAAVSVLPGEQLEATHALDRGRTAGQIAGVLTTNLGPGRDKLLVRGLSDGVFTGRARATVGTYLDDAPINYDAPNPDLRLVDVDRIEVVRGPQGALYGDGALAGVYRIVPRKPDLDAYAAGVSASVAETRGGGPSHAIDLTANLPLAAGRAALRLVGYREIQGGYLDDTALHRSNLDRTRRDGGRAALRITTAADWTLDLSGAWQDLVSSDSQYATGPLRRGRANRIAEAQQNRFAETALAIHGRVGGADLASSTALVRHQFGSLYDASAALDLFGAAQAELGVYAERRRVTMLTQDLVLSAPGAARFGWLAGLYAVRAVEDSPAQLTALSAGRFTPLYSEVRQDRLHGIAGYGEASWAVSPSWTLALGARAAVSRLGVASWVSAPPPGRSRALRRSERFSGFAPKASAQHDLAGGGLIYGLISTGERPGGVNSSGILPLSNARARFAPDRLRNFEIGWRNYAPERRLSAQAAVFYDQWRDIQTDRYLSSGLAYTANVGDAETFGAEAEAVYRPGGGLTLKANLLLTHARFTRRNPDFAAKLSRGLPGMPPISGGVLALYERPLPGGPRLRLTAEANYLGRSQLTFDAADARPMGGYADIQLAAGLVGASWSLDLTLSNPADSSADTFAYGNPFSFGQVRQTTPLRPRTLAIAVAKKF